MEIADNKWENCEKFCELFQYNYFKLNLKCVFYNLMISVAYPSSISLRILWEILRDCFGILSMHKKILLESNVFIPEGVALQIILKSKRCFKKYIFNIYIYIFNILEKSTLHSRFTLFPSKFFPAKIPFSKIQKKNLAGKINRCHIDLFRDPGM